VILRSAQSETKENKVAARDIVPVVGDRFEQTLESASPDVLREMIRGFAQKMMDAEVEVRCNAGYGEVTPDRVNSRNGYRMREWDTRAGTVELAIPRLREGSYFPEFLEHRRRSGPWPAWSRPATYWAYRPGGWRSSPPRWA
jgi:Transposase, Mutator family